MFVLVALITTVISAIMSAIGMLVLITVKVGMGLVVVLGSLCILALLFEPTRDFFKAWLHQAAYYAVYTGLFMVVFLFIMACLAAAEGAARSFKGRSDQHFLNANGHCFLHDVLQIHALGVGRRKEDRRRTRRRLGRSFHRPYRVTSDADFYIVFTTSYPSTLRSIDATDHPAGQVPFAAARSKRRPACAGHFCRKSRCRGTANIRVSVG